MAGAALLLQIKENEEYKQQQAKEKAAKDAEEKANVGAQEKGKEQTKGEL